MTMTIMALLMMITSNYPIPSTLLQYWFGSSHEPLLCTILTKNGNLLNVQLKDITEIQTIVPYITSAYLEVNNS